MPVMDEGQAAEAGRCHVRLRSPEPGRLSSYRASDKVAEFELAFRQYQLHIGKRAPDECVRMSHADFNAWWEKEREQRTKLSTVIRQLTYGDHPLRTSLRMRVRRLL